MLGALGGCSGLYALKMYATQNSYDDEEPQLPFEGIFKRKDATE